MSGGVLAIFGCMNSLPAMSTSRFSWLDESVVDVVVYWWRDENVIILALKHFILIPCFEHSSYTAWETHFLFCLKVECAETTSAVHTCQPL